MKKFIILLLLIVSVCAFALCSVSCKDKESETPSSVGQSEYVDSGNSGGSGSSESVAETELKTFTGIVFHGFVFESYACYIGFIYR